jgi:endonuclease/exonuclease/phosphatase family metal-dependent hydrolase
MMNHDRPGGAPLCVATYNIHQGIGRDGRRDLARVAAVLRVLNADLIALQEVHASPAPHGVSAQMHDLAELGDYQAIAGPTILAHDRLYGNALLTRLPVESIERLDLSQPGREPRGAVVVRLRTPCGQSLHCIATHLGLSGRERRGQIEILSRVLATHRHGPLVLLGDFNAWSSRSAVERTFRRLVGPSPRLPSFPSSLPLLALDRIWVRPPGVLLGLETLRTPLTYEASDHLPVVGRLCLSKVLDAVPAHHPEMGDALSWASTGAMASVRMRLRIPALQRQAETSMLGVVP